VPVHREEIHQRIAQEIRMAAGSAQPIQPDTKSVRITSKHPRSRRRTVPIV